MLDDFEAQIVRAVLSEIGGDVAAATKDDPAVGAKIQIADMLLSVLLSRRASTDVYRDSAHEVATIQQAEKDEAAAIGTFAVPHAAQSPVTAASLTPWLREKLQLPRLEVTDLVASLGGFSKQTYVVSLTGADIVGNRLVLRRDQAGGPVEGLAADEFPVIRLMFDRGVAVPEPLIVDRAPPFGATVIAMKLVPGATAFDLSGAKIGPQGRNAALAMARVLAKVHATPPQELGARVETIGDHVRKMVAGFEAQWKRRRVKQSPTLEAAFAWLYANIPNASAPPGLVHGDASLRNLLLHDGRETAMLDWELWHLGDPLEDLAYSRIDVEQVLPWDEYIAEYRRHGGRAYDDVTGRYYGVWGAVRNAVFAESLLYDFSADPRPQAKFAFGALALGRKLVPVIAGALGG